MMLNVDDADDRQIHRLMFDRWKTEDSDDAYNDDYFWWGYRWL